MAPEQPNCPSCGAEAEAGSAFCHHCGVRVRCPNGHALGAAGLRFCETCGSALEGAAGVATGAISTSHKTRIMLIAGAAIVAVGALGGFAAFGLFSGDEDATEALAGADGPTRTVPPRTSAPSGTLQPGAQTSNATATPGVGAQPPTAGAGTTSVAVAPTAPAAATAPPQPATATNAPPAPTATAVPPATATATLAATASVACFPVTVNNTTPCIMGIGTSPPNIPLTCVPVGTFVGLSASDARFKSWSATGTSLADPLANQTTFRMPANAVTVTLACGP